MPFRTRLGLLALVPILVLPVLIVFLPPDGLERARPAQFLGRFHPLAVHLPIALVLLVPLLELAGRSRRFPDLRASVDFVLALATVSSVGAAILGWCLARSGGYSGRLVTQHMWGGVLVAAACWLCWMLRGRLSGSRYDLAYTLGLVAAVGTRVLDGISRRPTGARRKSPYRTNACGPAQVDRASARRRNSFRIGSCLFLWRARGAHLRPELLFLPWSGEAEIPFAARQLRRADAGWRTRSSH